MPGSFMCSCKKGFHAKQSSAVGCNCTETEIESSGSSENTSNKSDTILCRGNNGCRFFSIVNINFVILLQMEYALPLFKLLKTQIHSF